MGGINGRNIRRVLYAFLLRRTKVTHRTNLSGRAKLRGRAIISGRARSSGRAHCHWLTIS